jgi:predicted nucleotide-binding protein
MPLTFEASPRDNGANGRTGAEETVQRVDMVAPQDELLAIADRQSALATACNSPLVEAPINAMERAAKIVGKAWSGSWLGYQSCVYYKRLAPPPAGAHFSSEWGFMEMGWVEGTTTGDWEELADADVKHRIRQLAGNVDLEPAREFAKQAARKFEADKADVSSIISTEVLSSPDPYLESLKEEVDKLPFLSEAEVLNSVRPTVTIVCRDTRAVNQGTRTPPHIAVLAEVHALRQSKIVCDQLSSLARKAGSHIGRRSRRRVRAETIGTNVFIGHGRSLIWKELKDFIQDRLRLPWDEFNRVPIAGVTNASRLSEMLDAAAIAFLIVTGEDELKDGTLQPRMNVVHEAGLFQGRLGFSRAIILLEEGGEEFSNIQGLGQIRFPKGKIKAVFEEVRLVLERKGILSANPEVRG